MSALILEKDWLQIGDVPKHSPIMAQKKFTIEYMRCYHNSETDFTMIEFCTTSFNLKKLSMKIPELFGNLLIVLSFVDKDGYW